MSVPTPSAPILTVGPNVNQVFSKIKEGDNQQAKTLYNSLSPEEKNEAVNNYMTELTTSEQQTQFRNMTSTLLGKRKFTTAGRRTRKTRKIRKSKKRAYSRRR